MPKKPTVSTPTGVLPDKYKAAALLDAHGHSRAEIATQLGVSQPTIARLRRTPEYRAEVAKMADLSLRQVQPLIDELNTHVIKALHKAITTLESQLDAENDEGQPLYTVRTESAKLLTELGVKHLAAISAGGRSKQTGAAGDAPSAAAITVTINHSGEASVAVDEADVVEDDDYEEQDDDS